MKEAILEAGMDFVGMERFEASEQNSLEESLRHLAEADLLLGIIGTRYGSIPEGKEHSYTESEHRAAKHRLVFKLEPGSVDPNRDFDPGPDRWKKQELRDKFLAWIEREQLVRTFCDNDLQLKVTKALNKWRADRAGAEREASGKAAPSGPSGRAPGSKLEAKSVDAAAIRLQQDITNFRATVATKFAAITLAGFETNKVRMPIGLDDLYVELRASVGRRYGDEDRKGGKGSGMEPGEHEREIRLRSAFDRGGRKHAIRGVVLLGEPGSGKTTHLKRLAYVLATKSDEVPGLPEGVVPIFLPLRNLEPEMKSLRDLIDGEYRSEFSKLSTNFAAKLIKGAPILYLLDGLDEVSATRRVEIKKWIQNGHDNSDHQSFFLVSSRFAGYTPDVRLGDEFLELHLRPMNPEESRTFIHKWYTAVETSVANDLERGRRTAASQTKDLLKILDDQQSRSRRLAELVGNPLLLTALCLVHRDRARLPERRVELYEECINVLIELWRSAKKLHISVDAKTARQILQPMAYWLHQEEKRTRATAMELEPILGPALAKARCSVHDAETFLQTIRDESGLLTGFSHQEYGFLHLGFQEYLAAREFRSLAFQNPQHPAEPLNPLLDHFGESWWREVTMLLLALEDPYIFEPFFSALVERSRFVTERETLDLCLEEAGGYTSAPFIKLLEKPGGKNRELWERQEVAAQILKKRDPSALAALASILRSHPSENLRAFVEEPRSRGPSGGRRRLRSLEFVTIRAGESDMGSPDSEAGRESWEGPVHRVQLNAFQLAVTPVTNGQYQEFLAETKRAAPKFWSDRNYNQTAQPVVGVDWDDAVEFCSWLDNGARLPTEAEWEYACRAGSQSRYWRGDSEEDLAKVGWFVGNSEYRLHAVGELPPNPFGLYDMHGNVWEWCRDWFGNNDRAKQKNPPGRGSGPGRVIRGGGFGFDARGCRSAYRNWNDPSSRRNNLGFRVALSLPSS